MISEWHGPEIVSRGRLHEADKLAGFVAISDSKLVGLVTFISREDATEIITINSLEPGKDIGSALLSKVKQVAGVSGHKRLWLVTTNDNMAALRFYQREGFVLVALHREAIIESRRLKPTIPRFGIAGIPLRDELELEYDLTAMVDIKNRQAP